MWHVGSNSFNQIQNIGEGIVHMSPGFLVSPGNLYLLEYFFRRQPSGPSSGDAPSIDNIVVLLTQSQNSGIPVPNGSNGQPIPSPSVSLQVDLQTGVSSTSWQSRIVCFNPNLVYDQLVIYPRQNISTVGTGRLNVDEFSVLKLNDAGPDKSICPGGSVTIGPGNCPQFSAPQVSYLWQPSTGLSSNTIANPLAFPATTTVYTLTVTATTAQGVCTATDVVQVAVLPVPSIPVILPGINNDCNLGVPSNYSISNPNPNITYQWAVLNGTPASGTGTSLGITWTAPGGVIQVTAIDNTTGCQSVGFFSIEPCCLPPFANSCVLINKNPNPFILVDNVNNLASNFFTPNQTVNGQTIIVNGTFTIDINLDFTQCHFFFGPNEKIVVNPGVTLGLYNRTFLEAGCCKMWDGIYLTDQTSSIIADGISFFVLIEDAKNAIVSNNGGKFVINRTIFTNNHKGIVVNPFVGNHPGKITFSEFRTGTSPLSPNALLLPPYAGQRGHKGVEINEVSKIQVGDPATATNLNKFTNLDFGITSFRSSVDVYNNNFNDITSTTPLLRGSCNIGTAICMEGFKNEIHSVKIGGSAQNEPNKFTNCSFGVLAMNQLNVEVINNWFSMNVANPASGVGIDVFICSQRNIKIHDNRLFKFRTGIRTGLTGSSQITILNNELINNGNVNKGTAIFSSDIDLVPGQVKITGNTIARCQTGINTLNVGLADVSNNTISFLANLNQPGTYYGIRAQNTGGVINQNSVSRVGVVNSQLQPKMLGISAEISPGIIITNNSLSRVGSGIRCLGAMPNSTLSCNDFLQCFVGLFQDDSDIGQQGAPGQPSDNTWRYNVGAWKTIFANNGNFVAPTLYYRSTGAGNFQAGDFNPIPFFAGSFTNVQTTSSNIYNCSLPNPCPSCQRQTLVKIAGDQAPYDQISMDSKYSSRQHTWKKLKEDSSLMYSNASNDSILQNFYFGNQNAPLGKLIRVKNEVRAGNLPGATNLNSSITPQFGHEDYQQKVNEIYISALSSGNFNFSQVQDSLLNLIARQNPHQFGRAVYDARALLGVNFDDNATGEGNRVAYEDLKNETQFQIKLYPNPAQDKIYFEIQPKTGNPGRTLFVYNHAAQLIETVPIPESGLLILNTEKYTQGMYLYQLAEEDTIQCGKFIISR